MEKESIAAIAGFATVAIIVAGIVINSAMTPPLAKAIKACNSNLSQESRIACFDAITDVEP